MLSPLLRSWDPQMVEKLKLLGKVHFDKKWSLMISVTRPQDFVYFTEQNSVFDGTTKT